MVDIVLPVKGSQRRYAVPPACNTSSRLAARGIPLRISESQKLRDRGCHTRQRKTVTRLIPEGAKTRRSEGIVLEYFFPYKIPEAS